MTVPSVIGLAAGIAIAAAASGGGCNPPSNESCAGQIAENYRRLKDGRPLINTVDPAREY